VVITKTRLDRLACDGLALDPEPFRPSRSAVRGILAHAAIERDWTRRGEDPSTLVRDAWDELASRSPGDPSSVSAWMNALSAPQTLELRAEVVDLVVGFREIWPPLPSELVRLEVERPLAVDLGHGRIRLFGRPDLRLRSRRRDGRARTLVVDLKTGRPRPEHDRQELRFYALLATLVEGMPPFRWATFYVTEGRYDVEDLRVASLEAAVRRVVDGIRQHARIAGQPAGSEDPGLRILGGGWCLGCKRRGHCPQAADGIGDVTGA
jgi:hypothetical protein